jgi:mono/diheme cytochrome c family protein
VVRKELVSITRGGKQVVRVSREGTAPLRSAAEEKKVMMGLYNRYCLRCHGVDGRGVWDIPKVPKFTDGHWQTSRSDAQIVRAILEGRGEAKPPFQGTLPLPPPNRRTGILFGAVMPPFRGTLTLEEAWGMARYLRMFAPATETPRPNLDQTAKPAATPK